MDDSTEEKYNGSRGLHLHHRDDIHRRRAETYSTDSYSSPRRVKKESGILTTNVTAFGVIFTIFVQMMGTVWWASSITEKVNKIETDLERYVVNGFSKTQAESQHLNLQLQIDHNKASIEQNSEDIKEQERRHDKLSNEVHRHNVGEPYSQLPPKDNQH